MEIRFQTSGCNSDCESMIIRSKEGLGSRSPLNKVWDPESHQEMHQETDGSREKIMNRRKVYSATLWW